MRILYITQWFDPEPNVIKGPEFVKALERAGHHVTVLTGLPNYPTGKIYPGYRLRLFQREVIDGVEVRRLPLYPSHSHSSIGRTLNFLSFFLSVLVYGVLKAGRYDVAYVYHPPITVGLAAALFGPLRRVPFILEIQDLWPDTVLESGMGGTSMVGGILSALCDFVYRRAERIIVQSEGIKAILSGRNVPESKLATIHNWADEMALAVPSADVSTLFGFEKQFTFVYGGNLGPMQGLDQLIRAANMADSLGGKFELFIFGEGIDAVRLHELKKRINAANVRFHSRVSRQEARDIFAAADVLVVHLANKDLLAATIPSKTQFYLACGKPILAGVKGEAADILRKSGAALVNPPEDVVSLAESMIAMSLMNKADLIEMGQKGKNYYEGNLSFEVGIRKTLDILATIVI